MNAVRLHRVDSVNFPDRCVQENFIVAIMTFFKKLFGGDMEAAAGVSGKTAEAAGNSSGSGRPVALKDLENFVNYVVTALVDFPDDVQVTTKNENNESVIWISCRKEDTGKIIGKKGKTIIALRSLVASAAGRMQNRVKVEVAD